MDLYSVIYSEDVRFVSLKERLGCIYKGEMGGYLTVEGRSSGYPTDLRFQFGKDEKSFFLGCGEEGADSWGSWIRTDCRFLICVAFLLTMTVSSVGSAEGLALLLDHREGMPRIVLRLGSNDRAFSGSICDLIKTDRIFAKGRRWGCC